MAQQRILNAIRNYIAREGISPTLREIGDSLGLKSQSTVEFHLRKLEEIGAIGRQKGKPRSMQVLWSEVEGA